jgi:hypothetical protein
VKKLKKFKRYDEGGAVGAGSGDPFSYTDFKPGQGERNLEGIKDFFMGRRSRDETPAPIEDRDTSRKTPEPAKETKIEKAEPVKAEPAKTSPVKTPSVAQQMKDREKGGPNERNNYASVGKTSKPEYDSYSYGPDYMQSGEEGVDSRTFKYRDSKKAEEYRQSLMPGNKTAKPAAPKPAADLRDMEKGMSRGRADNAPAAPKTRSPGPEDIPGTEASKGPKGELIDNSNLPAKQFAQSVLGASPAMGGARAAVRGAIGLGRFLESAPKAEGAGTGKFPESKSVEVSNKPAIDRVKEANIQGPPKPPRQETPADKMGVRETSAMEKSRKANQEGPPDVGARARRVAEDTAKADKQAETTMAAAGRRAQQTRADEKQAADAMSAASKRAKENRAAEKQAADTMASAGARAKQNRAENKQASDVVAAAKKRADTNRAQKRSDAIPAKDRDPGFMKEYIAGRAEKRNRIKDLPNDGLSAERFANKKGGKIPAFKKGGVVGHADGCAIRGKTKGRMV